MIAYLLLLHFVADFVLQSREMGQKKSVEFKWLLKHLCIQWIVFFQGLFWYWVFVGSPACVPALTFITLNVLIHGVIDWYIWRGYKYSVKCRLLNLKHRSLFDYSSQTEAIMAIEGTEEEFLKIAGRNWKFWDDHLFYTTIGFDQLLHALTLVILAMVFL